MSVERGVGKLTGDEEREARGEYDSAKGDVQRTG